MRPLLLITLFFAAVSFAADEKKADVGIPQPIVELKLTNGAVFRNVTIVRYDSTTVVLKSSAGTGPLSYTMIPEPLRAQMLAEKAKLAAAGKNTPAPPMQTKSFRGQVFIATQGGESRKLGDVKVYAIPAAAINAFDTNMSGVELPKPLAQAVTDADGRFTLTVAKDAEVFVFAQASRYVGGRTGTEYYLWAEPEKAIDPANVLLSNRNQLPKFLTVKVAD